MLRIALSRGWLAVPVFPTARVSRLLRAAMVATAIGGLFPFTSAHAGDARVFRVAALVKGPQPAPGNSLTGPIAKVLEELGYVEGRNIVFDRRFAAGDASRFGALAAELVALKPDVIIAETTPGALAAKAATSTIPIVFFNVTDPIATGILKNVTRPGGNITGISDAGNESAAKSLQLLQEIVPSASRIAVLMSDNPVHPVQLRELRKLAEPIGVVLVPVVARSVDELDAAFASVRGTSAMIILGGPPFGNGNEPAYRRLAEFQQRARLPIVCGDMDCVRAGGLFVYSGGGGKTAYRAVAGYVDKILKGAPPGDLPVQFPTNFDLIVNAKAARHIGLVIPPAVQMRATRVIE